MRTLKNYPYVLTTIALIFFVNVGFANTTEKEKKSDGQEQEQESRRKSNQTMMRPDAETSTEPSEEYQNDFEVEEESQSSIYTIPEKVDSVKEESVSKYNFIFYFLYKFKYDGEEAP